MEGFSRIIAKVTHTIDNDLKDYIVYLLATTRVAATNGIIDGDELVQIEDYLCRSNFTGEFQKAGIDLNRATIGTLPGRKRGL